MTDACYTCDQERETRSLPPREAIAYDQYWRVAHAINCGLLGWLVLVPRRHIMELTELTPTEASGLGRWQVRLAGALTTELGAAKIYVAEFGEVPGFHLHFHVVPRAPNLDDSMCGPGIFSFLNRPSDAQVRTEDQDQLALRLARHLTL